MMVFVLYGKLAAFETCIAFCFYRYCAPLELRWFIICDGMFVLDVYDVRRASWFVVGENFLVCFDGTNGVA